MVMRRSTKTISAAPQRADIAANAGIVKMNSISNAASARNSRKRRRSGVRTPDRVNPRGDVKTHGALKVSVRVTLVEEEGPQPTSLVREEQPTPHLRVSSRMKNGLSPPPLDKNDNTKKRKLKLALRLSAGCRGGSEVP